MNISKALFGVGIALAVFGSTAYASCNNNTDGFGNTLVRYSDGTTGQLHTDQFENTTGRIGDQQVNTYRDSFGNTTGTVAGQRQNCFTDSFGNTNCR